MPLDLLKVVVISATSIVNILLGLSVLVRNSKNNINRIFFLTGFLYGIWALCLLFYEFPVIFTSLFWIKATYIVISIQQCFVLMFSFIFPKSIFKKAWIPAGVYSLFFFSLTIYLLLFTNSWIMDVTKDSIKGLQTILGSGYLIWSAAIWLELGWAVYNFISNISRSSGKDRAQLLYLLLGFFMFGVFATIADIIIPVFYKDSRYFPISTASSLFFTFTVAYVIIKHRFMDIRLVVARSVAYISLILIFGTFYIGGLFLASTFVIRQATSLTNLIISTILALFMALTFQPLKSFLQSITDNILYRGSYDQNQLLSALATIMSTNIELKSLVEQLLNLLNKKLRLDGAVLVLLDQEKIQDQISAGFKYPALKTDDILPLIQQKKMLIFDELEEGELKQKMRTLGIFLSKVLTVENETVGILILSGKLSGEIYSDQDLRVIEILAPEMAVAVQNAQSYERIKKFNIILTDEVKKATGDLQAANTKLQELDKLKDDFVSVASHELRTPMTAIRSYSWMALHRSDIPLSEKLKRYLYRTLISTERLINLVNDLLNISRIEGGKIEIAPRVFDIQELLRDVLEDIKARADEKEIKLLLLEHADIPLVFADADKVREILLNLLGNSIKFTYPNGTITIDFFTDGQMLDISIKDTGSGIDKEDLGRLFQKFGRLESSYVSMSTSGGTGLGLYISKSLVELMHGKIWANSNGVDKGATFTFSLPVASEDVLRSAEKFHIRPLVGEAKPLEPAAV